MKLLLGMVILVGSLLGQSTNSNWAGVGIGYNSQVTGIGLYAKNITGNTYSFSVLDVIPTTYKPVVVSTQISTGVAQRVFSLKGVDFFIPTSAGITYTGVNTGWNWNTGGLVSIPVGKTNWRIFPNVRVSKSSIVDGYQLYGGILLGWGW